MQLGDQIDFQLSILCLFPYIKELSNIEILCVVLFLDISDQNSNRFRKLASPSPEVGRPVISEQFGWDSHHLQKCIPLVLLSDKMECVSSQAHL